jgi:hypothetical protein
MTTSLAELSGLLEEEFKEFSSAQLLPFFPETLTTEFNIRNDREGELLLGIISPDPFTVRDASMDFAKEQRQRSITDNSAMVAVVEDIDIDFMPVELTLQFSNTPAALEL